VGLVNEAQLGHRSNELGKLDLDPSGDKADHNSTSSPVIIDPIHLPPLETDYEGDREVYMVGQGDEPREKTTEEIQ
jgi:hypothetical protein